MDKNSNKRKQKEDPPIASMFENVDRMSRGNLGDQYHQNSWKSILVIIVVLIVGYLLYATFT